MIGKEIEKEFLTHRLTPIFRRALFLVAATLLVGITSAQLPPRQVNQQAQFWTSINSTTKFNDRWGLVADAHIRRNNFIQDPSFYFLRAGLQYQVLPNFNLTVGYGHMWIAPSRSDWQNFSNENRLYQQAILVNKVGNVNLVSRIRNEQRWQQIIVNDKPSGRWRFTNRIRYLLSATIPVSKNKWVPQLVLSNELLVHFGKPVLYNAFDQNRIFIGIKQQMSKDWSFDFGYMMVYQQKFTGFQYDMNHTTRLFFYYTPKWKKGKISHHPIQTNSPDE
jgi:hypothetical protein